MTASYKRPSTMPKPKKNSSKSHHPQPSFQFDSAPIESRMYRYYQTSEDGLQVIFSDGCICSPHARKEMGRNLKYFGQIEELSDSELCLVDRFYGKCEAPVLLEIDVNWLQNNLQTNTCASEPIFVRRPMPISAISKVLFPSEDAKKNCIEIGGETVFPYNIFEVAEHLFSGKDDAFLPIDKRQQSMAGGAGLALKRYERLLGALCATRIAQSFSFAQFQFRRSHSYVFFSILELLNHKIGKRITDKWKQTLDDKNARAVASIVVGNGANHAATVLDPDINTSLARALVHALDEADASGAAPDLMIALRTWSEKAVPESKFDPKKFVRSVEHWRSGGLKLTFGKLIDDLGERGYWCAILWVVLLKYGGPGMSKSIEALRLLLLEADRKQSMSQNLPGLMALLGYFYGYDNLPGSIQSSSNDETKHWPQDDDFGENGRYFIKPRHLTSFQRATIGSVFDSCFKSETEAGSDDGLANDCRSSYEKEVGAWLYKVNRGCLMGETITEVEKTFLGDELMERLSLYCDFILSHPENSHKDNYIPETFRSIKLQMQKMKIWYPKS